MNQTQRRRVRPSRPLLDEEDDASDALISTPIPEEDRVVIRRVRDAEAPARTSNRAKDEEKDYAGRDNDRRDREKGHVHRAVIAIFWTLVSSLILLVIVRTLHLVGLAWLGPEILDSIDDILLALGSGSAGVLLSRYGDRIFKPITGKSVDRSERT
jgi:hypothetical protein